eukprot:SM000140S00628  [mRNA]  locus=s140:355248:358870:- [translate_table: standard]
MTAALQEMHRAGLFYLDSLTSSASVGPAMARRLGVPCVVRDVFLDAQDDPAAVRLQLKELERLARRNGHSVGIGHPYQSTLGALQEWLPAVARTGFKLVSLMEYLHGERGRAMSAARVLQALKAAQEQRQAELAAAAGAPRQRAAPKIGMAAEMKGKRGAAAPAELAEARQRRLLRRYPQALVLERPRWLSPPPLPPTIGPHQSPRLAAILQSTSLARRLAGFAKSVTGLSRGGLSTMAALQLAFPLPGLRSLAVAGATAGRCAEEGPAAAMTTVKLASEKGRAFKIHPLQQSPTLVRLPAAAILSGAGEVEELSAQVTLKQPQEVDVRAAEGPLMAPLPAEDDHQMSNAAEALASVRDQGAQSTGSHSEHEGTALDTPEHGIVGSPSVSGDSTAKEHNLWAGPLQPAQLVHAGPGLADSGKQQPPLQLQHATASVMPSQDLMGDGGMWELVKVARTLHHVSRGKDLGLRSLLSDAGDALDTPSRPLAVPPSNTRNYQFIGLWQRLFRIKSQGYLAAGTASKGVLELPKDGRGLVGRSTCWRRSAHSLSQLQNRSPVNVSYLHGHPRRTNAIPRFSPVQDLPVCAAMSSIASQRSVAHPCAFDDHAEDHGLHDPHCLCLHQPTERLTLTAE